jgi:acetyltransferase-like isoleucine patch superfamily enzyme
MWTKFWMRFAGLGPMGRLATRCAVLFARPHKARVYLARMNPKGFVSPSAVIHHAQLHLGNNIFMDDRVVIFQRETGGPVEIGDRVFIYRDTILETGDGGHIRIGSEASVHPRCQINAYKGSIEIGKGVMIAPSCALYSYDHGIAPGMPIREQPLRSKGDIVIGEEAWLSFGVIVLGGVRIGDGAVVAAGSVVTRDVPDNAIAAGNPARVIKMRSELA